MKNTSFYIWLLALAVPVFALVAAQVDTSSGDSIGGGGYDLGPFVYSWLLNIVTGLWSLCALLVAVVRRDPGSSMRGFVLSAIGFVTLAAVFLVYRKNLS